MVEPKAELRSWPRPTTSGWEGWILPSLTPPYISTCRASTTSPPSSRHVTNLFLNWKSRATRRETLPDCTISTRTPPLLGLASCVQKSDSLSTASCLSAAHPVAHLAPRTPFNAHSVLWHRFDCIPRILPSDLQTIILLLQQLSCVVVPVVACNKRYAPEPSKATFHN